MVISWGGGGLFWVFFGLLVWLVSLCRFLFLCGFMIPVSQGLFLLSVHTRVGLLSSGLLEH